MIYFETERLWLRDWQEADLELFCKMNADDEVMRYFPKKLTTEESIVFQKAIVDEFTERGFGLYAVEEKASGAFVGFIGFHRATFEADFTPCVEIGWRLRRESWGKGYATEAASACLSYGFSELDFKEIYSFTAEINKPSQNVMKKLGMDFVKTFEHPNVEDGSTLKKHVLFHTSKAGFKSPF